MDRFKAWLRKVFTVEPAPLETRKPYVAYLRFVGNSALFYLAEGLFGATDFGLTNRVEMAHRFETEDAAQTAANNYRNGENVAYNGTHRVQR